MTLSHPREIAPLLLAWYDRHRRDLPWRSAPGLPADPYRVWLSEVMLQQTTVATVGPYFARFLARWPTVGALAAAPLDDVLAEWAGLGYYARARNLHACARAVAERHGGVFPDTEESLRDLPGIGAYTAAAVAAIAFDRKATVVDGNVERVVARLFAVEDPMPGSKPKLKELAATLTPDRRPGDFAQAMMDLGATVCVPRNPRCLACPIRPHCQAAALGIAEDLPAKSPKKARPTRHGLAFVLARPDGAALIRRRPPEGLLGGMGEFPSTPWREGAGWTLDEALAHAPVSGDWALLDAQVEHVFTHFRLLLQVAVAETDAPPPGIWARPAELDDHALPTVMRKVAATALGLSPKRGRPRTKV